ncbi:response regulator [Paraburkholderia sp. CNPSo 3157]|uniref:Response regulator n=1 Tax=Paraburkholderia franconis TaxID=2654983 RepID=A0A7X1TL61_9BURK|nr:response regulator [Paraburkholderia franconis]MPW23129.1 response regulator [Paraburkholderia franconis]
MTTVPVVAIVDDDVSVREAIGLLVRSFDFAVELYGSGRDLLSDTALDRIACIITDIHMPVMNGFVLSDALRARGFNMPIIFMTAFAGEGYEERARESGAACFLNKPFKDTDILRCLQNTLKLPPD